MEPDDTRSVRVEFESGDSSPLAPAVADSSSPSRRGALILAVLGVLGVVAMVFVLRPAEDKTADGNVRGTTTTIAPSTTRSSTASSTPRKSAQLVPAQGLVEHNEIARGDNVFLALQFEEAENGLPRLARSVDGGLSWASIATTLDSPSEAPGAVILRDYESLIATDSGFALLMSTIRIRDDDPNPVFEVVRLISSNGASWVRDPAFEVVVDANLASPVHHSPAAFVVIGTGFTDARLNEIALATVRADALLGEVCFAEVGEPSGDADSGTIEFFYCGLDPFEPREIRANDLINPERFVELRSCLAGRALRSGSPNTMLVIREGIEPTQTLTLPERLVEPPLVLDDGTVVIVDLDRELRSTEICSGLLDVPASVPALLRWDVGEVEPELFPLPDEITINFAGRPLAVDDRVLMLVDSTVWSINVTSGDWSRLMEIPDGTIPLLFEDGRGVVAITRSSIAVSTDVNPTWESADLDLPPGTPTVDYADTHMVIITSGTSSFVIDLPFEPVAE